MSATALTLINLLLIALGLAVLLLFWIHLRLRRLRQVTEKLAAGNYTERVLRPGAGESGKLGRALNLLADKVQEDIARMRRLEELRREFVANVSHELKTPLTSIRGFAETLRAGAVDDPAHRLEFLEAIESDAQRLTALVDDLLDLSAIESGRRKAVLEPVSILDIAREAAARLKPLAERRGVTLRVYDNPELPLVKADRGQIGRVLRNLLENAVKFNREGGSAVVRAEADAEEAVILVTDTGSGIPKEDIPRIFERFYRVDKARSSDAGGTGLGLSIVKHIVEGHGGCVDVQSRLGEGSIFRVRLPLLKP